MKRVCYLVNPNETFVVLCNHLKFKEKNGCTKNMQGVGGGNISCSLAIFNRVMNMISTKNVEEI